MRPLSMISILLLVFSSCSSQPDTETEPLTTIAFGSCSHQDNPDQLWDEIRAQAPDLWIWGGDNIYGDSEDMSVMKAKYDLQKQRDSYQQLISSVPNITGIWDDHDYGVNDGGVEYPKKEESKQLMLDFLDVPEDDPRRNREGAYGSQEYGPEGKKVKVILLDTRYFRSALARDTIDGQRVYKPTEGTLLGEEQWKWLEKELRETTAQINLVVSSIQLIPDQQIYEKWANLQGERERFFDLLAETQAPGVIVLSGDRHIAEFSRLEIPGLPYPLIDFTSSGLTHTWSRDEPEANRYRVGEQIIALNYGLIEFEWDQERVNVYMSVRGHDGKIFETLEITF